MSVSLFLILLTLTIVNATAILNFSSKDQVIQFVDRSLNGTKCGLDLKKVFTGLYQKKVWAVKMIDASGKLSSGLFNGNRQSTGDYDECLAINEKKITGQYCTIPVTVNNGFVKLILKVLKNKRELSQVMLNMVAKVYYGICVPKSCTVDNLKKIGKSLGSILKFTFNLQDDFCFFKKKHIFTLRDFLILLFLCSIFIFEVSATILHGSVSRFSISLNLKKLFSNEMQSSTCLYGIKSLSILWIVIAHVVLHQLFLPQINSNYSLTEWAKLLSSTFFLGAQYSVDSFFAISGFLLIYRYMSDSKNIINNIHVFYLARLLRLLPTLLAVILIDITLIKFLVDGPFYRNLTFYLTSNCEKNWWSTLLFLNNLKQFSEQCNPHTWYLSVDTQLYILSPVILFFMKRAPKKTLFGILVACLISYTYTWYLVIQKQDGFVLFFELRPQVIPSAYLSLLCRAPAWLIGACFGYFAYSGTTNKFFLPEIYDILFWVLSLATMLILVAYQKVFIVEPYNVYRSAIFHSFSRSAWALSLCYIIFSLTTQKSGFLKYANSFLSHQFFVILARLSYPIYLIHPTIMSCVLALRRQPLHFSNFGIFHDFCSMFALTVLASLFLSVIFESPFIAIVNRRNQQSKEKQAK